MNISKVEIKNFKGIKYKEIEFKSGFNLIKGVNGKGKTSILQAIAVGLGGYVAGLPEVSMKAEIEMPVILYLGAGRVWASKKEKVENIFGHKYIPTVGYTDALRRDQRV
ncbi:MAG: AAA family ATPase [Lachnospiraceae bacterium]|nr:AAA family ATPase [Lachnospiraceae bacterium]